MGIPVFYMELAIGQRMRKSPLHIWNKLSPYLAGVGLSSVVVSFMVGCYYNMIVAWCFYYLFISFQAKVPYAECPCKEGLSSCNVTGFVKECAVSSPTTYFWYREALNTSATIDDSGVFNWKLALCLLLSWIVIFAITCKGAESIGKVYILFWSSIWSTDRIRKKVTSWSSLESKYMISSRYSLQMLFLSPFWRPFRSFHLF